MRVDIVENIESVISKKRDTTGIAIYPYGNVGHNTELILKEQFGIIPDLIVDNSPYMELPGIFEIDAPQKFTWLISTMDQFKYCEIKNSLVHCKVPFSQIVDIYDNEKDIREEGSKRQEHYNEIIQNIRRNGVIRLAAYVVYKQTFAADRLFSLAMNDKRFIAKIVVVPLKDPLMRVSTYRDSKEYFIQKYGEENIIDGYDVANNEYIDNADSFDVIYFSNPYDCLVDNLFQVVRLAQDNMNTLPIYISYGYDTGFFTTVKRLNSLELNYAWRCFVDCEYSMRDYQRYQFMKGRNTIVSGYAKMDSFLPVNVKNRKRKKILICSHHSIVAEDLQMSCFLRYRHLITRLPDIFPMCDFVFRPHPLLFNRMIDQNYWSEADQEDFLEELFDKNIEFSDGGDYFSVFNECDAIIHDCGSFTVEWLFTGKPGCFMWNERLQSNDLTELMKFCLKYYSMAYNEEDIIDFINNVIEENETKTTSKEYLKEIAPNWPNATSRIYRELLSLIL